MRTILKALGVVQALLILWAGPTALQVPLMRNPSLAGTFVALTLFGSYWAIPVSIVLALSGRHIPLIVFITCQGVWLYAQREI